MNCLTRLTAYDSGLPVLVDLSQAVLIERLPASFDSANGRRFEKRTKIVLAGNQTTIVREAIDEILAALESPAEPAQPGES